MNRSKKMNCLDVVAWICLRDKQLLCARTKGNSVFYLPGGKRELGESDWSALSREVTEEVSVSLIRSTFQELTIIEERAHGHGAQTWVTMKCFRAEFVGELIASGEIEETAWLTYADSHRCAPATQRVIEFLFDHNLIS